MQNLKYSRNLGALKPTSARIILLQVGFVFTPYIMVIWSCLEKHQTSQRHACGAHSHEKNMRQRVSPKEMRITLSQACNKCYENLKILFTISTFCRYTVSPFHHFTKFLYDLIPNYPGELYQLVQKDEGAEEGLLSHFEKMNCLRIRMWLKCLHILCEIYQYLYSYTNFHLL